MHRLLITIYFLFSCHSSQATQSDADIFFELYGKMIRSKTLTEYIGHFSSVFEDKSTEWFERQCGWKCRLGLSSEGERRYLSSQNYDLYRNRQVHSFTGYRIESQLDSFVIHLEFKYITAIPGDITYSVVTEDGMPKISHILFSDEDFGPFNKVEQFNFGKKERDCMMGVISLNKREKVKEHWKCF